MERANDKRPVVLLLAADAWVSTARLAMSLAECGCRVELVAPRRHPALATRAVSKLYPYDPLRPLGGLRRAMVRSGAVAVIAADEVMVLHLEEIWLAEPEGSALRLLLQRSLGGLPMMEAGRSRITLLELAKQAGVPVPETMSVESPRAVERAMLMMGSPIVLKSDASSGGRGVRLLSDPAKGRETWRALHLAPSLLRALKRGVVQREWTHLRPWAQGKTRGVTAQKFVRGGERTAMAVCRDGRVLACVCLQVVYVWSQRGPSSVLQVIDDAEMERAVQRVSESVKLSGFCGFDFIVDEVSEERLLIEMNPRPTQLAHLPLGAGRDLVATYVREIAGLNAEDRQAATQKDLIALFPQELQRTADSEMLGLAFHDVPWSEPALMERAMGTLPVVLTSDPRWRGKQQERLVGGQMSELA